MSNKEQPGPRIQQIQLQLIQLIFQSLLNL